MRSDPNLIQIQIDRTRYFKDMAVEIDALASHFSVPRTNFLEQKLRLIIKSMYRQMCKTCKKKNSKSANHKRHKKHNPD